MVMEHDIYFSKKENCFCNICTSHSYEIMTEFYKMQYKNVKE